MAMSTVVERAKKALEGLGKSSSLEAVERYTDWLHDGGPKELLAEIERVKAAAKTLGKIIDDSLMDVARATDSLDLLDEDRDGDWMLIFERLAALRPDRDAARAEVARLTRLLDDLTDSDVGEAMAHNNELMHERNDLLRRNEALQAEVRRLGGGML
jgi:ABC-type transporter Mla subunit MlaD